MGSLELRDELRCELGAPRSEDTRGRLWRAGQRLDLRLHEDKYDPPDEPLRAGLEELLDGSAGERRLRCYDRLAQGRVALWVWRGSSIVVLRDGHRCVGADDEDRRERGDWPHAPPQ